MLLSFGLSPVTVWSRAGYTGGLELVKSLFRALSLRRKSGRHGVSEQPGRYPRRASNLTNALGRRIWLTSSLLDLLWLYGVRVRIWQARGRTVVCDRYLLDCLVDFRVNFPEQDVENSWLGQALLRSAVRPDAAFCLMVPPELTLERARLKARFHWESQEVLEDRWRQYRSLSNELNVQIIDAERPAPEIARFIQCSLTGLLPDPNGHQGS